MILSFLFLFIDKRVDINWGAGDLLTSRLPTPLNENAEVYNQIHELITNIYNDLTNGTLPAFASKIPFFYSKPKKKESEIYFNSINDGWSWKSTHMQDFKNLLHPASLMNYHLLYGTITLKAKVGCSFSVNLTRKPVAKTTPNSKFQLRNRIW